MSSHDLDRLVKEKLDEISPSYHPDVWVRINKKIKSNDSKSNFTPTLIWLIAGLSSLGLIAFIYRLQLIN